MRGVRRSDRQGEETGGASTSAYSPKDGITRICQCLLELLCLLKVFVHTLSSFSSAVAIFLCQLLLPLLKFFEP